ncbi:IS5 family transposase ISPye1 [Vreelandella titanicae]
MPSLANMAKKIVPDELWEIVEPLLPPEPSKPDGGRPRVSNRAALFGILFVLKPDIPWEMLPQEMGCGSGVTCWRRPRDWHEAGVWKKLHQTLLEHLQEAKQLGWDRAYMDSASIKAKRGSAIGPNPTDRGRPGTKRHLLADQKGTPLADVLSGANCMTEFPYLFC